MRLTTLRRLRRLREGLKLLWEDDEERVRRKFRSHIGREPDLEDPRTFNEKILWLNLRTRDPRWVACSDKVAVRDFVRERVGEEYLVPLLGVYEDPDDLDPERLPHRFIIKAAHGSGWNLIVRDKRMLDWEEARRQLRRWLASNFHAHKREWQYRRIPPRLVVEELLLDETGNIPADYKIFSLRNESEQTLFFQVDVDRFTDHRRNYYDLEWNRLPFERVDTPNHPRDVPRPARLEEMVRVARALAGDFCLVRVDLYCLPERVYFGELTFSPDAGMARFRPPEWDLRLGELIGLPAPDLG